MSGAGDEHDYSSTAAATRYRGVTYEHKGVWRSRIYYKGRHITLGRHATRDQAARAHDAAASFVFGPVATTNFRYVRAVSGASKSLPFGAYVKKQLMALRQIVAQPAACGQKNDAQLLRAEAAAVAFACGRRVESTGSHSGMHRAWAECAFRAAIAVAARLPT